MGIEVHYAHQSWELRYFTVPERVLYDGLKGVKKGMATQRIWAEYGVQGVLGMERWDEDGLHSLGSGLPGTM